MTPTSPCLVMRAMRPDQLGGVTAEIATLITDVIEALEAKLASLEARMVPGFTSNDNET